MKLLVCVVTHNRLNYTKRTLASLAETVFSDDRIIVVDNSSEDGTVEYLRSSGYKAVYNRKNLFPGAACNIGWHQGLRLLPDADLLMRSDNDIEYLPGWREEVEKAFQNRKLGQLGILNRHEDYHPDRPPLKRYGSKHAVNAYFDRVGGNCVIPRHLYDRGLRWIPGSWGPGGMDEDSIMSEEIRNSGFKVAEVIPDVANNMSFHRYEDYPEYYQRTAKMRGLVPELSV